jgi:hypothetical protein
VPIVSCVAGEGSRADKRLRLRYAGACRSCGMQLTAGTMAVYERTTKTVRCLECSPRPAGDNRYEGAGLDVGTTARVGPTRARTTQGSSRRERRQRSRRTRGPARHPGSCAPPFAYSPTGSRMRRAMMTAATLDAMVTTCAKVASSNGHCWMRSTRFSKASAALRRPACCWSTASVGSS